MLFAPISGLQSYKKNLNHQIFLMIFSVFSTAVFDSKGAQNQSLMQSVDKKFPQFSTFGSALPGEAEEYHSVTFGKQFAKRYLCYDENCKNIGPPPCHCTSHAAPDGGSAGAYPEGHAAGPGAAGGNEPRPGHPRAK